MIKPCRSAFDGDVCLGKHEELQTQLGALVMSWPPRCSPACTPWAGSCTAALPPKQLEKRAYVILDLVSLNWAI